MITVTGAVIIGLLCFLIGLGCGTIGYRNYCHKKLIEIALKANNPIIDNFIVKFLDL